MGIENKTILENLETNQLYYQDEKDQIIYNTSYGTDMYVVELLTATQISLYIIYSTRQTDDYEPFHNHS